MVGTKAILKENKLKIPSQPEMGLIMGLLNYKGDTRYLRMKEILNNAGNFFKPQVNNFPKYIRNLERNLVVVSSTIEKKHKYRPTTTHKVWRLRIKPSLYGNIRTWCWVWDTILLEEMGEEYNLKEGYLSHYERSNYANNIPPKVKEEVTNILRTDMKKALQKTKDKLLKEYEESIKNMIFIEKKMKLVKINTEGLREKTIKIIENKE